MIPRIYSPTETDFSTNGLGILKDTTKCEIYEVANGKYELELEYPLGTRFDEYFENDYQIKAKSNDQEEYHIFFIDDKDIDTFLDTVTIYAQSRTNRLGRRAVTFAEVDSKTGREAMAIIENNMDKKSDIRLYSDITTVSSTTFEARNVLNCIAGEQGSLLQYWGGEIKREPFKLSLLKRRGRDNIGTIRYGKDLSGLKVKLDWTGVKTRIIPYADPQSDAGTTSRIYGSPVDSEYINNYPDVYTEHVQFTEEQGVKDVNSLNKIAKNYFKTINPGCDKPKISITVEFDKLTDTEEGKEFAKIRNYGLFDTFKIYHRKYKLY
ncbi:phage tail spike protein, partial [Enterococcus faecium]